MTIRQAIEKITMLGYHSAAKWAVAHALGIDGVDFILSLDKELCEGDEQKVNNIIKRLRANEPMQYVLGKWQFIDIELITDKRALIPRPETELLAMEALQYAKDHGIKKIADIGCGTGCIGLFLKSRIKDAEVTLVDISDDALSLARENAKMLNLECEFLKADMLETDNIPCGLIVSNPPYIKSADINMLDANVKDYEPHTALDGGEDGLIYYRALAKLADASLDANGAVMAEVGIGQSADVEKLFKNYFDETKIIKDLNGIERIVMAKRG